MPLLPPPSVFCFLGLGVDPLAELRYEAREPDSKAISKAQSDFPVDIITCSLMLLMISSEYINGR